MSPALLHLRSSKLARHLRELVPTGRTLTAAEWDAHHRLILRILCGLAVLVPLCALAAGLEAPDLLIGTAALVAFWALARRPSGGHQLRMICAALGLMTAASLLVAAAHGELGVGAPFYVLLPLTILYGAWSPFAVAVAFVAVHHVTFATIDPRDAFLGGVDVTDALLASFAAIVAESFVCLAVWRALEARHAAAEAVVAERTFQLRRALAQIEVSNAEVVRRLSMAVEFRDEDTGAHIERIGRLSAIIAAAAGMDTDFCERLRLAAPLHDVGKVAIPDAVLLKPGKLDCDEWALMQTHAEHGHRLLRGSSSELLDLAATIAWTHHERWDGRGYPRRLAGSQIPIEGRIVAIADVYDALTSDRVYRKAMTIEQALEIMHGERGRHFDPDLFDVFVQRVQARYERPAKPPRAGGEVRTAVFDAYLDALRAGDAEAAVDAIEGARRAGWSNEALFSDVLGPAMVAVGDLWAAGQLTVSAEHLASGITQNVLARLSANPGAVAATTRTVLLATAPGDHHTIGLLMACDVFASAGWRTDLLSADVNATQLSARAGDTRPDLIALAVSVPSAVPALRGAIEALHDEVPGVPVLVGGPAAPADLADLGVAVVTRADEIITVAELLLGRRPVTRPARAAERQPVGD